MRPSFEQICMDLAFSIARRSTCQRKSSTTGETYPVGCVVASADFRRILSWGYNGNAAGLPNGCDDPNKVGGCGCIHAEENAMLSLTEPRETEKIIFVTHLPCVACAKRIIQKGKPEGRCEIKRPLGLVPAAKSNSIQMVYWATPYRITEGLDLLEQAGIPNKRLMTTP